MRVLCDLIEEIQNILRYIIDAHEDIEVCG